MPSSILKIALSNRQSLLKAFAVKHQQIAINGRYSLQCICRLLPDQQLFRPSINTMSTDKTETKSDASNPIKIITAKPIDGGRITQFLHDYYYPEEPLTIGAEPTKPDPEEEEFNLSFIEDGTCLLAIQYCPNVKDGDSETIVGAAIAGEKSRGEADRIFTEAERLGKSKYAKMLKILGCLERETNVYDRFNVNRVLHVHILTTSKKVRGQKLGTTLMKEIFKLGCDRGFDMVTLDCSSYYSARLCQRMGMKLLHSINYADYLDECGFPVFLPPPPHTEIATFGKVLKEPESKQNCRDGNSTMRA